MTSYRLSIVTFALGRTVKPQYITLQTDNRQQTDASLWHKRDRTKYGRLTTDLILLLKLKFYRYNAFFIKWRLSPDVSAT